MIAIESGASLKDKLKEVFGYSHFRGNQEEIIRSILAGINTFVIMPTGAGKSLCYQLPALVSEGTAIVISPLIALMKNQVDQLNAVGVNAKVLNSTLSKAEMTQVKKEVINNHVKLLYVAPESLTKEENMAFLAKANISFIAIDEAHCISEWGHDFRPEYRKIRGIVESLGNLPVIALTATATPKVQQDIQKNLQMEDAAVYKSSFNRKNLYYEVRPKVDAKKQLIKYVKNNPGKAGIVYCLSRKKVEEIAELLNVNGVKARPYHAGLEAQQRMDNQDAFLNEEIEVIVATIAFGMGIDKPDVRFVIHYDVPKSLEGYYQETGRAGRDGLDGHCLMFYSRNDLEKLEKFNKDKPVTERENAKHLLDEMATYAEIGVCRRRYLLHYFGEYMDKNCGFCDNDLKPTEKFEAQDDVWLTLKTAVLTGERFGIEHLTDVMRGELTDYVKSYNHNTLEVFGKGRSEEVVVEENNEEKTVVREKTEEYWNSVIRQVTIYNFLEKDVENFGVLRISEKGKAFLEGQYPVQLSKNHDYSNVLEEDAEEKDTPMVQTKAHDQVLFDMLKTLRRKIAKEKNLPPYVIFQDPSLEEMATVYPVKKDELSQINGVGMGKVQKFGQPFLDLIAKYVADNEIETASDVVVKTSGNRSKIKIQIIQQIDRKVDLEDIADSKDMTLTDLLEEIEHICYSGTRLNLDYYIGRMIDGERQEDIYDYFMHAETDSMKVALDELGEEYSEEELRLMRIKFISEVAN